MGLRVQQVRALWVVLKPTLDDDRDCRSSDEQWHCLPGDWWRTLFVALARLLPSDELVQRVASRLFQHQALPFSGSSSDSSDSGSDTSSADSSPVSTGRSDLQQHARPFPLSDDADCEKLRSLNADSADAADSGVSVCVDVTRLLDPTTRLLDRFLPQSAVELVLPDTFRALQHAEFLQVTGDIARRVVTVARQGTLCCQIERTPHLFGVFRMPSTSTLQQLKNTCHKTRELPPQLFRSSHCFFELSAQCSVRLLKRKLAEVLHPDRVFTEEELAKAVVWRRSELHNAQSDESFTSMTGDEAVDDSLPLEQAPLASECAVSLQIATAAEEEKQPEDEKEEQADESDWVKNLKPGDRIYRIDSDKDIEYHFKNITTSFLSSKQRVRFKSSKGGVEAFDTHEFRQKFAPTLAAAKQKLGSPRKLSLKQGVQQKRQAVQQEGPKRKRIRLAPRGSTRSIKPPPVFVPPPVSANRASRVIEELSMPMIRSRDFISSPLSQSGLDDDDDEEYQPEPEASLEESDEWMSFENDPFQRRHTRRSSPSFMHDDELTTSSVTSEAPVAMGSVPAGLSNLGNTCFMNSCLQCLFVCPPLMDYFLSGDWKKDVNKENALGMQGRLAQAFFRDVRKYWEIAQSNKASRVFAPYAIKRELSEFAPRFVGYNQQDAQEFCGFLLDGLHEDLNRVRQKEYVEMRESDGRPDAVVAAEAWQLHRRRNRSFFVDHFQGQLRSRIECPKCSHVSITFDPLMYLALPIRRPARKHRHDTSLTLTDCLESFTQQERLNLENSWYCGRCKEFQQAHKKLDLWRLPDVLVIGLKRFRSGGYGHKVEKKVEFPLEELDLSRFVLSDADRSDCRFELFGVSNHSGSLGFGHYFAYTKLHGKWYRCDDSMVEAMPSTRVMSREAYILFYRRKKQSVSLPPGLPSVSATTSSGTPTPSASSLSAL